MKETCVQEECKEATLKAPNVAHDREATERWVDMASKTAKDSLLALFSNGTLVTNELFYHLNAM